MKCYYEELGVPREASDGDIKTAYRKLALRWHPDKNLDCAEEAKEKFQLIQQAYDVLSDSQERAWYDNHREQILRGKNSEYEENCLDLFQYFTVSCFKGYGDDAKGFYKVYAEVFEKLAAEDAEFMEDEEEVADIPKFGDSTSSYEEVVGPFYAYWQSYCTKKTYTWLCPYDIQEIKDRRVLREIEKDLKKVVQKAKRERNEEVRNLVSFIRKRDKRVQAYKKQLEERAALNRQKQEQNRLEQIRKRHRELEEMRKNNSQTFNEGYEEQLKQLEQQYGDDSCEEESEEDFDETDGAEPLNGDIGALNLEEGEEYVDDLYCVACNRAFKNEKAFGNHETSKKHRENVERLRQEMLEEEDLYGESEETTDDNDEDIETEEKETTNGVDLSETENVDVDNDLVAEDHLGDPADPSETTKSSKKAKKSKKTNKSGFKAQLLDSDEEADLDDFSHKPPATEESDDDWGNSGKKGGKKSKNKPAKGKSSEIKEAPKEPPPKVEPPVATAAAEGPPEASSAHMCVTCKSAFESKNKLFAHLKKTNHGVYIPKGKPAAADTGKKAKGKRK